MQRLVLRWDYVLQDGEKKEAWVAFLRTNSVEKTSRLGSNHTRQRISGHPDTLTSHRFGELRASAFGGLFCPPL